MKRLSEGKSLPAFAGSSGKAPLEKPLRPFFFFEKKKQKTCPLPPQQIQKTGTLSTYQFNGQNHSICKKKKGSDSHPFSLILLLWITTFCNYFPIITFCTMWFNIPRCFELFRVISMTM